MNRREFNTSLAALAASPILPVPAVATSQPAAVSASTYAWAQLIARAQTQCSPAMLARHLRISPDAAQHLFNALLHDGVLRAPGIAGVATAANPIEATGVQTDRLTKLRSLFPEVEAREDQPALVKDDPTCQMCDSTETEEDPHARTPEPVQEGPQER